MLKHLWDKSNVTWVLRGKQVKVCQCKKSRSSFVCSRQQKIKNFSSKDDNDKLWVEVIIVTSLDSDDKVEVRTSNNNDANILYGIWVFHTSILLMVKKGIHFSHAALTYLSKDPLTKPPVFY